MARKKELKTIINELFSANSLLNLTNKLKLFLFYSFIMGLIINYSLWIIFKLDFKWYTFPAYGMFLYLIQSEMVSFLRDCFHKENP